MVCRSMPEPGHSSLAAASEMIYEKSMAELDAHTLRVVADLVRSRVAHLDMDTQLDGLQRIGVERCFNQLARDLDISADHAGKPRSGRKSSTS
jgi:predicted PhzF superfamily epimerase YddE/YHI9